MIYIENWNKFEQMIEELIEQKPKRKVTLKEIITFEKALLELEESYSYELPIGILVRLNKALKSIGNITDIYFTNLNGFVSQIALKCPNLANNEVNAMANEYSDKLLNGLVDFNTKSTIKLIKDIKNEIEKNEIHNRDF